MIGLKYLMNVSREQGRIWKVGGNEGEGTRDKLNKKYKI